MVSIHIVPVIVYLIIKVISSTFRFKSEGVECPHWLNDTCKMM